MFLCQDEACLIASVSAQHLVFRHGAKCAGSINFVVVVGALLKLVASVAKTRFNKMHQGALP